MNKLLCTFLGILIGISSAYPIYNWVLERELSRIEILSDIGMANFLGQNAIELNSTDFKCKALKLTEAYASTLDENVNAYGEPKFYEPDGINDYLKENVAEINNMLSSSEFVKIKKNCSK